MLKDAQLHHPSLPSPPPRLINGSGTPLLVEFYGPIERFYESLERNSAIKNVSDKSVRLDNRAENNPLQQSLSESFP